MFWSYQNWLNSLNPVGLLANGIFYCFTNTPASPCYPGEIRRSFWTTHFILLRQLLYLIDLPDQWFFQHHIGTFHQIAQWHIQHLHNFGCRINGRFYLPRSYRPMVTAMVPALFASSSCKSDKARALKSHTQYLQWKW